MSKLGYIQSSYGKQINIASANTYSYNVLSGSNLPVNTLIISSPVDDNENDVGTYSLLMTDSLGNPVRLSYTIQEGNGLKYENDYLSLSIDNSTLIDRDGKLVANVSYLVDDDTIKYDENKIRLNIDSLIHASTKNKGLFKIDDNTIKNDNDYGLHVITQNLKYSNPNSNIGGIFIGDGKTIVSKLGVLSLNEKNIKNATSSDYGFIQGNGYDININDGVISVDTSNLQKADFDKYGIIKPDNNTVIIDNDNNLSVDVNKLNKCSSNNKGVFKYDSETFEIKDSSLAVKNYDNFDKILNKIKSELEIIDTKIKDIDYILKEYEVGLQGAEIFDFHCSNLITSVLEKPIYLNQPINEMPYQFISTDFVISTNCPFTISLKFEDNTDPKISLYSINYNTIDIYTGNSGLMEIYQTTEGKKIPIKMTFIAKNYYKDDKTEYSNKVKIKIIVAYANDLSINKSLIYSIVRFNSGYNEEIVYDESDIEILYND